MTIETKVKTALGNTYPVYAGAIPKDGTVPCYVYQRISTVTARTFSGNGAERPRIQVSCWGTTYTQADTLKAAALTALDLNQVNFKLATRENEMDDHEPNTNLFRKILDFYIWD